MYAFTTHASEGCEKPRSLRIDGSATFTTVESTTIIRSPTHRITSASQRVRVFSWLVMGLLIGRTTPLTAPGAGTHRRDPASRSETLPATLFVLRGHHDRRQRPPAPSGRGLIVRPHAVLVEVPPRLLLLLALAVSAHAQAKQEVDEQHGQPATDG